MKKILLIFVPAIHNRYLEIFNKYQDGIYLIGQEIINKHTNLFRDVRGLKPEDAKILIKNYGYSGEIKIINEQDLADLKNQNVEFVLPNEDISHLLHKEYFSEKKVEFINTFLRWDQIKSTTEFIVPEQRKKTSRPFDREAIDLAFADANKSSDWWRQIGAVLVKDDKVLITSHNHHLPSDYHLSIYGDPRSNFDAGERIDIYTSIHGEADIVAKAANRGISLVGTSLYVTTFPCSNCARLIGEAGIKKLFYSKGYSRLDAEVVLNSYGVEIILVE